MKREFQVGDVCRIRQWDDMAAEFGLKSNGNIKCLATFTDGMRHLCGKLFTIISKDEDSHIYYTDDSLFDDWIITDDMLELAINQEDEDLSDMSGFNLFD